MRDTAPSRASSCVPTLLAHCLMARQGAAAVRRSLVHRRLCCTTEAGLMMCIASVLLLGGVHAVPGGHVRCMCALRKVNRRWPGVGCVWTVWGLLMQQR